MAARPPSPIDVDPSTPSSQHSRLPLPVSPLAPLEYLQNQRRGSITDPSLHAHVHSSRDHSLSTGTRTPPTALVPPPGHDELSRSLSKANPTVSHSAVPYVFGDATPGPHPPPADKNLRRLLHSPTESPPAPAFRSFSDSQRPSETFTRAMSAGLPDSQPQQLVAHEARVHRSRSGDMMETRETKPPFTTSETAEHQPEGYPPGFDWGMRRHSIAVGSSNHHLPKSSYLSHHLRDPHGVKRKMSFDRNYPTLNEETDLLSSRYTPPFDGPANKARRGSAFDTQRIASLSLYDRRDSIDSRLTGSTSATQSPQQYWDRRDSVTSTFSNMSSVGGYASSGFSAESGSKGVPSNWLPNNSILGSPSTNENQSTDGDLSSHPGSHRGYDSRNLPPVGSTLPPSLPPMPENLDRRLSVPDVSAASTERPRRIRPRPNSREPSGMVSLHSKVVPGGESSPQSASSTGSTLGVPQREGASPYSRSPELRVSHKLAERKRRKEMKEMFDEMRDQLPSDRSMKASKWEIMSKAIDYIAFLQSSNADYKRQVEILTTELEKARNANSHYPSVSNPPIVHSQAPTIITGFGPPDSTPGPASSGSTTSGRSTSSHPYTPINGTRSPPR